MIAEPGFGESWGWLRLLGITLLVTALWLGSAAAAADNIALLLPLGIIGGLPIGVTLWKSARRAPWALTVLLVATVVLLSISFREREVGTAGLDGQSGLKFAVWLAILGLAALNVPRLVKLLADPVMMALACYTTVAILSTIYSPVPVVTASGAMGILAYGLFAGLLAESLTPRTIILALLLSLAALMVGNHIFGWLNPDVAYVAVDPEGSPGVYRFRGFSGHPNTLGRQSTVFALVIFAAAYMRYIKPVIWVPLAALAVTTTLATESRTSLFALVLAVMFQIRGRYLVPMLGFGALIAIITLLTGGVDTILSMVGRDGSVSEAETMSGRTDIWHFATGLIGERPLTGYGFNSFEAYASTLWTGPKESATETHNNFISILYSTGLIGAVPFFAIMGLMLYRWIVSPFPPRDAFVVNVLFTSFSETDMPTNITPVPTMIFFIFIAIDAYSRLTRLQRVFDAAPHGEMQWT